MKTKIQVVGSKFAVRHYDGGKKSENFQAKVIILDNDDPDSVDVGTLRVPLALVPESHRDGSGDEMKIRRGEYIVDFKIGRGYSDDTVGGRICEFLPVASRPQVKPDGNQPQKAA